MREPYTQLYVHLDWATWDRMPLLTDELHSAVYACIQAECNELKSEILALGGVADHVHLLVRIPASVSISELLKQVKGSSSHLATHRLRPGEFFKWQGAHGSLHGFQNKCKHRSRVHPEPGAAPPRRHAPDGVGTNGSPPAFFLTSSRRRPTSCRCCPRIQSPAPRRESV